MVPTTRPSPIDTGTFFLLKLKWLEIGFDLSSSTFQEGWQGEFVPEIGNVFVDCESRAIGREFEKDLARFTEVETLEIVAINFAAIWDAEIPESPDPGGVVLFIWNPERDMVNTARTWSVGREVRTHSDM